MMKKAAFFTVCAFAAGTACAANVTLYGLIDTGISVARNSVTNDVTVQLKSGQRNGSRIGFKGEEKLDGGWKVGFVLEDQFTGDSGNLQGQFWGRESSLYLDGSFGRFTFGMLGALKSPVGTTGLAGTVMYPFGTLMSNYIGGLKYITTGTYLTVNNAITYRTPEFNGFSLHAQYSLAATGQEGAHTNSDDRYIALAARYKKGPMTALLLADTTKLSSVKSQKAHDPKAVTAGVNYDFGIVRPFVYAQYFEHSPLNTIGADFKTSGANTVASGSYKGFGVLAALQWPMFGGKAKIGGGYMDADGQGTTDRDVKRYSAHVGYDYSVSKRTDVYADLGWIRQKASAAETGGSLRKITGEELSVGIVHRF